MLRIKYLKQLYLICFVCIFFTLTTFSYPLDGVKRSQYLEYAKSAAEWTWDHQDERIANWKQNFDPENVFGYRPPGGLLEMAVIYAHLYHLEKNQEYAQRARTILITYHEFRELYPQWATARRTDYDESPPILPDFFTVMRYIRAYVTLKNAGIFNPSDHKIIETTIADSMAYLLRSQEWGTMNRTVLRAESLAWAVSALPNHPEVNKWEMLRQALGDDNWGNWEIEDATIYHGVWLYALCGYAHALDKMDELFRTPEMYYYAHYFLNLMSPADMIPDFGDANWMSNWDRYLVFFEAAAKHYQNSELKWAATSIARKFIDFANPKNIGLGYILLDCYLWGSDDIQPVPPKELSQEVMEDVQGKKIVFRNGWNKKSTYLLLNYRDEGDGGLNFRDYLRDTIPVEEEKMTHGHADENSIVLLMSEGSVLLHDGGYRDYMPSGPYGAYRQDYFHNRLCVRPEKIFLGQNQGQYRYSVRDAVPGQDILEFLRNAGSYRAVRTQKVDFLTLPDFDYSRTRLIDEKMGYEWDRVITYVKDREIFVVFDVFKARKEDYYTLSNLWHTRQILAKGEHWYDTRYDRIQDHTFANSQHLLIAFPSTHFRMEGTAQEKRHYQDEWMIHQTAAQHFELGETLCFVTVLVPHPPQESPQSLKDQISLMPIQNPKAGAGIQISTPGDRFFVGVKNDLRMDIIRDWRRPRYTYESGKIQYGDFETNGDYIFAHIKDNTLRYTVVNLTKVKYQGDILFEAEPGFFGLAFDASPDSAGTGKLRYWRDSAKIGESKE